MFTSVYFHAPDLHIIIVLNETYNSLNISHRQ